ncbi:hypothetical protein CPAR01_01979 [Colletotrichum paranaense]|uniref:Uncharacterized protein n=2 Tax=Colletotrichum acutatum species complex TaxID=2707335 RepID=A0A9Q0B4M5_9PEZI|nr:uncharacterized protein CPAR01_01979 [Colletotrichum paranaense]XP_060398654.1 uncharacterized protein CABS01_11023 [Colletotrichum abscissum]KAI3553054.1 hypothetical protein CABS02_06832 [Colletotrichum abscissum]KAK1496874.1 hypothetical protein CABS01_11023 [Colletotrichum abscissum]KAK1544477.1 hypothetical protein CPAR01_01979 [Colletotrichum paranaense]
MTTQPPSSTHMARSRLNRQIRGCETTIFLLHGVSRTRAQKKHAASSACFPFFPSLFSFFIPVCFHLLGNAILGRATKNLGTGLGKELIRI